VDVDELHRVRRRRGRRGAGRRAGFVVLAAIASLLAACSSDSGSGASSSTSVAPPGAGSVVPAGEGSDPGTSTATTAVRAVDRDLETTQAQAADLPGYNIYRPVDLGATGAPLPVIVWANGGCLRFDAVWAPLLEAWAAAGFVVVAITAPPDGTDPRTAGMTTAADQAAAIDWAEAANRAAGGEYAGHLDLDRVVAAGNSCGGVTALTLASQDDRVASAFVLSGSSALPGSPEEQAAAVMAGIDVPVGFVIGGPEDISTPFATKDLELLPDGVPGYLARRASATHPEVSTDPAILAEVAEISTTWIDFTLTGDPALESVLLDDPCGACPPGTWTVDARDLDAVVAP
jgi:alpha-beta hydrolase superfamily lysophospholipase